MRKIEKWVLTVTQLLYMKSLADFEFIDAPVVLHARACEGAAAGAGARTPRG